MTSAAARSIDAGAEAETVSVVLASAWPSRVCAAFTSISLDDERGGVQPAQ
jgi:hypothetical protein